MEFQDSTYLYDLLRIPCSTSWINSIKWKLIGNNYLLNLSTNRTSPYVGMTRKFHVARMAGRQCKKPLTWNQIFVDLWKFYNTAL